MNEGNGSEKLLLESVARASELLRRERGITAVHIVDSYEIGEGDQWRLAMLVNPDEVRLVHPHNGLWSLVRNDEPEPEPSPEPFWMAAWRGVSAVGRWSAGFDGLMEGAR